MSLSEVEIEYCGLLPAAEKAEHALLSTYGGRIGGLRFPPGHGVFRVSVDGRTVFDKAEEGFDLDAIVARVASG